MLIVVKVHDSKRADWNAIKRLLASGDIKGVRGYINWLQRLAKKIDPNNMSDLRWRANLLIKAAKHYGYDLNQGLKYKKFAKGDNISFDLPIDQHGMSKMFMLSMRMDIFKLSLMMMVHWVLLNYTK